MGRQRRARTGRGGRRLPPSNLRRNAPIAKPLDPQAQLARRAGRVLGIEGDSSLVKKAGENAAANGVANAEFQARDLFSDAVADWNPGAFSHVLVDPPRSGAIEALKTICTKVAPDALVYVSCNPATLARDAAYLTGPGGYQLTNLAVADMFPHTTHVESAALFVRAT